MVCAGCRQAISGKYLKVGRLAFHPEHFVCRACNKAIAGTFQTHQGMFLHPECFAERYAPRCAICNQPCADRFVKSEGRVYHERCFGEHKALDCVVCKRKIVGTALTDYWGNTYHAEHAREFAACHYCGKLVHPHVSGGGTKYPDGRAICRGCHKTAVHREPDAQRVVAAVRQELAGWGVDLAGIDVPIRILDRTRLAQLLKGGPHQSVARVSGFAAMRWEREGRTVKNKQATVYLLTGMPLVMLEASAAHELMHVWNFNHGPRHSFALEEGSCNYMSYRIHEARGDALSAYQIDCLMKDPDPAYGVGFRKVKRYAERHGLPRLLTLLERSPDFPVLDFGL